MHPNKRLKQCTIAASFAKKRENTAEPLNQAGKAKPIVYWFLFSLRVPCSVMCV